ncbi:unnamed protein product, partial [Adineta steineri]
VQREIAQPLQLSIIDQDISTDEQLKSTIKLDDERSLDSFWPIGSESWHIHETKPQRILELKNFSHSVGLVENMLMEFQSEIPEKIANLQTIISPNEIMHQTDEVHSLQSHKIVELDVHQFTPAENNSQNAETSAHFLHAVPLVNEQQQTHLEPLEITNVRYKPKLRLSRRHTNQKPRLHDFVSTSKQWLTKSSPNVKTIKILRDLESLLFYAIL